MTPKQKHEKLECLESELRRVRERFGDIIEADTMLHDAWTEAWLGVVCAVARAADAALAAGEPVVMAEAVAAPVPEPPEPVILIWGAVERHAAGFEAAHTVTREGVPA
jgi:hypothetical protein